MRFVWQPFTEDSIPKTDQYSIVLSNFKPNFEPFFLYFVKCIMLLALVCVGIYILRKTDTSLKKKKKKKKKKKIFFLKS